MRINPHNFKQSQHDLGDFIDAEFQSDPTTLSAYIASKRRGDRKPVLNSHVRAWEKNRRLSRMEERARKQHDRMAHAHTDFN